MINDLYSKDYKSESFEVIEHKKMLICLYCETKLEKVEDDGPVACLNCGKKAPYCEKGKNILVGGEKVAKSAVYGMCFMKLLIKNFGELCAYFQQQLVNS